MSTLLKYNKIWQNIFGDMVTKVKTILHLYAVAKKIQ